MQVLESVFAKTVASTLNIQQIYERIKSPPDNGAAIEAIRSAPDKKAQTKLKKELPIYIPSATIGEGGRKDVLSHTGYLFYDFDIDSPEDSGQLKSRLESVRFARLIYSSPRGNGLHIIVKCENVNVENHNQAWKACRNDIVKLIGSKYAGYVDESAKDVNRAVFLSYDADAIYKPDSPAYKFAPIGASSVASVESKIATPSPDTSTLLINVKGKAPDYDRFHQLADQKPNGYILRGYGELFSIQEGVEVYEYEERDVGRLFTEKPLKSVEIKPKFYGKKRILFTEGERNYHLMRQATDFLWLNAPMLNDRMIQNFARGIEGWYDGSEYDHNRITYTINKMAKDFDPSKKALNAERFIYFNSDSNMDGIEKAIEQRAIKWRKMVLKQGKATIKMAINILIEERDNRYAVITFSAIAELIEGGHHLLGGKGKISASKVRRLIQEDQEGLKTLTDYNQGRYKSTAAINVKRVDDALNSYAGLTQAQAANEIGMSERTFKYSVKLMREYSDNVKVKK